MSTLIAILLAGVAQSTPASPAARAAVDACALLTGQQIQTVQGVALKDRKPSGEKAGGMQFDQCFYGTSDFAHSVSLTVIRGATPTKAAARQYWKKTFEKDEEREEGVRRAASPSVDQSSRAGKREPVAQPFRAGEREPVAQPFRAGEREEESEARRIRGTGDEAVWTGDTRAGTLYVLSGPVVLRISVGGVTNEKERIARSRALAALALKRLPQPSGQRPLE